MARERKKVHKVQMTDANVPSSTSYWMNMTFRQLKTSRMH